MRGGRARRGGFSFSCVASAVSRTWEPSSCARSPSSVVASQWRLPPRGGKADARPRPLRARHRARADRLSFGDAGGRRRAALSARSLRPRRFCRRARDLQGAGDAGRAQSLCALWIGRAEPRLRGTYGRGAARRCLALAVRSVLGDSRRRRALGPRGLRHEERRRGGGRGGAALRRARDLRPARSASSSPATRKGRRSTARSSWSTGRWREANGSIIASSASRPQ